MSIFTHTLMPFRSNMCTLMHFGVHTMANVTLTVRLYPFFLSKGTTSVLKILRGICCCLQASSMSADKED
jgi:hypothetical protein